MNLVIDIVDIGKHAIIICGYIAKEMLSCIGTLSDVMSPIRVTGAQGSIAGRWTFTSAGAPARDDAVIITCSHIQSTSRARNYQMRLGRTKQTDNGGPTIRELEIQSKGAPQERSMADARAGHEDPAEPPAISQDKFTGSYSMIRRRRITGTVLNVRDSDKYPPHYLNSREAERRVSCQKRSLGSGT